MRTLALTPESDGMPTSWGSVFCVLPVIYRLRAWVRWHQLTDWFQGWVPETEFNVGMGWDVVMT